MPRMAPCGSRCVDRHLAYVGMTRHRTAVTLYAGQDEFRDLAALSDRLSRSNQGNHTGLCRAAWSGTAQWHRAVRGRSTGTPDG
jgi:hypothetical protein